MIEGQSLVIRNTLLSLMKNSASAASWPKRTLKVSLNSFCSSHNSESRVLGSASMLLMVLKLPTWSRRMPPVLWIWNAFAKKLRPRRPSIFSRSAFTMASSLPWKTAPVRTPPDTLPSTSLVSTKL